jgi:hypothetical protein
MVLGFLFGESRSSKSKFNKRALQERSHLLFEFPQPNGKVYRSYLPFLENCQITENGKSNLQEYSLLGRSNSLHAYLGARSRNLNVTFKITFLHLLDLIGREGLDDKFRKHFTLFYETKESARRAFFLISNLGPEAGIASELAANIRDGGTKIGKGIEHARLHREFYQKIAGLKVQQPGLFDRGINEILTFLGSPLQSEDQRYAELNKLVDLVIFWINLIRSSIKNNSENTTLGCPIVRLTHGVMYNNIPCIVENYSIRIVEEAGYDVQTLLPKQLEVNLSLVENRIGNFGEFEATKIVEGDNHVGWEAVLESNNMDPYNGVIK